MAELTNHQRSTARRTYYLLFGVIMALLLLFMVLAYAWTRGVSEQQDRANCRTRLQSTALAQTILIFDVPITDQVARSAQVDKAVAAAKRAQRSNHICN